MLDQPYRVRTPECVVFSYRQAGAYSRLLAWWVDAAIMAVALLSGLFLLGLLAGLTAGLATPLVFVFVFLVTSGYFVFFEWYLGGASPGKRLFRLRVIRDDGLKLTLAQSVVRNLLRFVDSLPAAYGVALVAALLSREMRRTGDHVARTLVVSEPRAGAPQAIVADAGRTDGGALAAEPLVRERVRLRTTVEEKDLVLSAVLRREELRVPARVEVFQALSAHLARRLELEKPAHLSDERFVCELAAAMLA